MTLIVDTPDTLFTRCEHARRQGQRVGFVPTMGALHDGHLSLVEVARAHGARLTVASIFVNPLQFGPSEDFARYPRTFDADAARCEAAGVDIIYAPSAEVMYPNGYQTYVELSALTKRFEGQFRPEHFRGVATVVLKLWNAVGACISVFGRKDYQQWQVLSRLALDLNLPIEVVSARTLREPDGLALSSRNRYLDEAARARATAIADGLRAAYDAYQSGERAPQVLTQLARAPIAAQFDRIDYVEVAHAQTLEPAQPGDPLVLLVAAYLGTTRLIDNLTFNDDPRP